jgi:hypothetical protein
MKIKKNIIISLMHFGPIRSFLIRTMSSNNNNALSKAEKKRMRKQAEKERKRDRKSARFGSELWMDAGTAEYICDPERGLRHVVPHTFMFNAFAKQRWYGRSLIDVLSDEFMAYAK